MPAVNEPIFWRKQNRYVVHRSMVKGWNDGDLLLIIGRICGDTSLESKLDHPVLSRFNFGCLMYVYIYIHTILCLTPLSSVNCSDSRGSGNLEMKHVS